MERFIHGFASADQGWYKVGLSSFLFVKRTEA